MQTTDEVRRVLIVAAAGIVIAWGAMGLYLNVELGYSPGLYGPDYTVRTVREETGLQAGDRVISVEGLPIEKLGMESRRPRAPVPRTGESRSPWLWQCERTAAGSPGHALRGASA